jgi:hypothetical protein
MPNTRGGEGSNDQDKTTKGATLGGENGKGHMPDQRDQNNGGSGEI